MAKVKSEIDFFTNKDRPSNIDTNIGQQDFDARADHLLNEMEFVK